VRLVAVGACLLSALAACDRPGDRSPAPGAVIEPRDERLEPVTPPDLASLEASARQAVERRQLFLRERLRAPEVSDADLGAAYGELGKAYHAFGYPASAVAPYRNALRLQPAEFRWPYYLAHVLREEGSSEALEMAQAARVKRPRYLAAILLEADLRFAGGETAAAEELYRSALAVDENCASAWAGLGRIAVERGETHAAVDAFEAALAASPEANSLHYPLALAYRRLGEIERATEHLARRGELVPGVLDPVLDEVVLGNSEAWAARGLNALRAGNPRPAARDLARAVALAPERHDIRLHLGAALARLGDLEGALAQYRTAAELEPGAATVHYNLGFVLGRLGRTEEALAALTRAVELDPTHKAARSTLGRRLTRSGRHEEALEQLDALLEIDPNHLSGRLWRSRALMGLGRHREALRAIEDHLALHPQEPFGRHVRARFLAICPDPALRDPAQALTEALALAGSEGTFEHLRTVAMAEAAGGDFAAAIDWQRRAIALAEQTGASGLEAEMAAELEAYAAGRTSARATW